MTTEQQLMPDSKKSKATRIAMQMIVGGAFGFFSVLGVDRLIGLDDMSAVSFVALGLALFFSLVGMIVFAMATNRKVFMLVQRGTEDDDGADFEQMRSLLFWSAICAFLYAAILVLMALANNTNESQQILSFSLVFALMLAQTVISVMLWTKYDELYRDIMKDSSATTFAIVEFGLIIWAAAAIYELGVTFDPLTVIVAITGVNLASQFWFCLKRGLT